MLQYEEMIGQYAVDAKDIQKHDMFFILEKANEGSMMEFLEWLRPQLTDEVRDEMDYLLRDRYGINPDLIAI